MEDVKFGISKNKKILSSIESVPEGIEKIIIPNGVEVIKGANCSRKSKGNNKIKEIVIPEGVKTICNKAFNKYLFLEKVTLPSTLEEIESEAFSHCSALKELILPEGLKTIYKNSFWCCNSLKKIHIPSTLVFNGFLPELSYELEEITVSKDNPAYSDCGCNVLFDKETKALLIGSSNSIIPEETKTIFKDAFSFSDIKHVKLPKNVTKIQYAAFSNSSLERIEFNEGLKYINSYAFAGCAELSEITLPSTLKKVGSHAFTECYELETVYLNADFSAFSEDVFLNCPKLKNIYVKDINKINKNCEFYWLYGDRIKEMKPPTIEELIAQNKSIKEINKMFKENELTK